MSKLFVTVLGTGNYSDCIYYKDDYSLRTPFIQEAIINLLYQSKDSKDKLQDFDMKIILTEKALQKNYPKERHQMNYGIFLRKSAKQ